MHQQNTSMVFGKEGPAEPSCPQIDIINRCRDFLRDNPDSFEARKFVEKLIETINDKPKLSLYAIASIVENSSATIKAALDNSEVAKIFNDCKKDTSEPKPELLALHQRIRSQCSILLKKYNPENLRDPNHLFKREALTKLIAAIEDPKNHKISMHDIAQQVEKELGAADMKKAKSGFFSHEVRDIFERCKRDRDLPIYKGPAPGQ
ncbi:MAG: hypothetical protein K0S29_1220 [Gammaproteobacteria bacterium]|jgi:hypothetical protein|nr:hypothetical protein [Gammaproteobacteria bacterium]